MIEAEITPRSAKHIQDVIDEYVPKVLSGAVTGKDLLSILKTRMLHVAEDARREVLDEVSADGEVVVTTDPVTGACLAVTRQDDEGQVLSVIWSQTDLDVKAMLAEQDAQALKRLAARCWAKADRMKRRDRPYLQAEAYAEWLEGEANRLREKASGAAG